MNIFWHVFPFLVGAWLLYGLIRVAASKRRWAVYYAALTDDIELLEAQLAKGTSPHCRTRDGRTPLMLAAAMGRNEACRVLMKHEARLGDTMRLSRTTLGGVGDYGTALHLAAFCGHPETVKELLKAPDHLQALATPDERGCTPLAIASLMGYPDLIRPMVKGGAETDPRDRAQLTPLMAVCAANYHSIQMLRALVYDQAKLKTALPQQAPIHFLLADSGWMPGKASVLVYGSRLWFPFLSTRMHMPSPKSVWEERLLGSTRVLIECKADVNAVDEKGRSPLILAAMMGRKQFCDLLLANGADPYHADTDGHTYDQYLAAGLQPKPVSPKVEARLRELGMWE
ncbi:MAG: ankyrin repeat domain-containing protein [Armatimonadota bacterium]